MIIRRAKDTEYEMVFEIMHKVYQCLEDKEIFSCDDKAFVKMHSGSECGFTVVAYDEQCGIVGSLIVHYPGAAEDNLGRDIGMNEAELQYVAHIESAVVLPEYRGKNLQLQMLHYAETIIDKNRFKYLLATVSPKNPASYKTMERNGYRRVLTKMKYNNLLRAIYIKEVEE